MMALITQPMVDFVGAFAGALALSIALALQFLRKYKYSSAYIMALYILGVFLVLYNLQPRFGGHGLFPWIRLGAYVSIIGLEIITFWDLFDGDPELIERARSNYNDWKYGNQ